MKKGIRSDSNKRKVLTSKKFYDTIATEQVNGRVLELYKTYVVLDVFSDNGYIKTNTDYKCPFCNHKEKTEEHKQSKEENGKITIEVYCKACKKLLISETLGKNEIDGK